MQNAKSVSPVMRILALAISTLLALGAVFALSGCGGANDEQAIRDGLDEQLAMFKNPTKENLEPYMAEFEASDEGAEQMKMLESYGIDIYEFLGHVLGKFDYTIGAIAVNGDKATADISVTNIDASKVMNDAITAAQNDAEVAKKLQEVASTGDQAAVMGVLMDYVYSALDAATETVTTNTQVTLTRTGNTWDVDEDSMSEILVGIYGNLAS